MAVKTQGTQLYFVDPVGDVITEVACITELTGLTAARDQVDTTCLSDQARSFIAGLMNPGQANFGIYADGAEASHIRLHQLFAEGVVLQWAAGWADGYGIAPTSVTSGGEFVLPTTRTWLEFEGFINDFPFEFAQNSVVTSNLGIQTSLLPTWTPKA